MTIRLYFTNRAERYQEPIDELRRTQRVEIDASGEGVRGMVAGHYRRRYLALRRKGVPAWQARDVLVRTTWLANLGGNQTFYASSSFTTRP